MEKYHGAGNDFLITENLFYMDQTALIKKICDVHFGVGADGFIVVKKNPLEMCFYNKDGSRASMCGNGIRTFVHYCYNHGYIKSIADVLVSDVIYHVEIKSNNPFSCSVNLKNKISEISKLKLLGENIYQIECGVPHIVLFKEVLDKEILNSLAVQLEKHPEFPNHTNVNFVHVIDEKTLELKTYERGVGWTLACGTGSTASFLICNALGLVKEFVDVINEGGILHLEKEKNEIILEGPSEFIAHVSF